ncbi:cation diffusion facilitator family transporter, partial [Yersinia pestis]|uniref:cation diffusion facilitator family transporter n=1 Tax=Yersinia pestis TaxID=632 RepID=UPI001F5B08B9
MAVSTIFSQDSNSKRLLIAFAITTLFMVTEAIGGWLSGSLALLADAGHMLTDSAALFIALMAVHFSQRKPDPRHTFGYLRLTTLAAFVNAAALLLIVILIVWEAVHRFFSPHEVMGTPMLIIAIAGLLANIFCFWILHKGFFAPCQYWLSTVQCGFARHTRPLKAIFSYPSVDTVWTPGT